MATPTSHSENPDPSVSKSVTRWWCKCPYCPFTSQRYIQVKGHVEYQHPMEEQVVIEKYQEVSDE